mmetsp:Transcript_6933/g.22490  ORF Transcript_6933/g.22490 Transcript_6933/m.22490 type:complete len:250 (-) Transcript_6933:63-812(-)
MSAGRRLARCAACWATARRARSRTRTLAPRARAASSRSSCASRDSSATRSPQRSSSTTRCARARAGARRRRRRLRLGLRASGWCCRRGRRWAAWRLPRWRSCGAAATPARATSRRARGPTLPPTGAIRTRRRRAAPLSTGLWRLPALEAWAMLPLLRQRRACKPTRRFGIRPRAASSPSRSPRASAPRCPSRRSSAATRKTATRTATRTNTSYTQRIASTSAARRRSAALKSAASARATPPPRRWSTGL